MITIVMVKKILTDPAVCLKNFQSKYNNDFKLTVGFDPTEILTVESFLSVHLFCHLYELQMSVPLFDQNFVCSPAFKCKLEEEELFTFYYNKFKP